jgi:hypothetical protein
MNNTIANHALTSDTSENATMQLKWLPSNQSLEGSVTIPSGQRPRPSLRNLPPHTHVY